MLHDEEKWFRQENCSLFEDDYFAVDNMGIMLLGVHVVLNNVIAWITELDTRKECLCEM
jgi:hypothetical protein